MWHELNEAAFRRTDNALDRCGGGLWQAIDFWIGMDVHFILVSQLLP